MRLPAAHGSPTLRQRPAFVISSLISARESLLAARPRSVPQKLSSSAIFSPSTSASWVAAAATAAPTATAERRLGAGASWRRCGRLESAAGGCTVREGRRFVVLATRPLATSDREAMAAAQRLFLVAALHSATT